MEMETTGSSKIWKFTKEINTIIEQAQKMTVESIIAAQLGMRDRRGCLEVLSETNKPVLFIQGRQDKRCTNSMVLSQAQLCKHAEIFPCIDSLPAR